MLPSAVIELCRRWDAVSLVFRQSTTIFSHPDESAYSVNVIQIHLTASKRKSMEKKRDVKSEPRNMEQPPQEGAFGEVRACDVIVRSGLPQYRHRV